MLVGLAIAVTTASHLAYMEFEYHWLVWAVGGAFALAAVLTFEWPRGFGKLTAVPKGGVRTFLLFSLPAAYVIAGAMLFMIVFMAVGNPLWGFPWQGCV